ncbi:hypothetical protein Btru_076754 [Bulinus truncatus]|nr:hypothetical protein Btru_076754 [Bulinus truncatus]
MVQVLVRRENICVTIRSVLEQPSLCWDVLSGSRDKELKSKHEEIEVLKRYLSEEQLYFVQLRIAVRHT